MRGFGIMPDAVVARSDKPAPSSVADKLSLFGGVKRENVMLLPNVDTVYRVPLIFAQNGFQKMLSEFSGVDKKPDLKQWEELIENVRTKT